jgi:hypothetical protein
VSFGSGGSFVGGSGLLTFSHLYERGKARLYPIRSTDELKSLLWFGDITICAAQTVVDTAIYARPHLLEAFGVHFPANIAKGALIRIMLL